MTPLSQALSEHPKDISAILAELVELAKKATPGPWENFGGEPGNGYAVGIVEHDNNGDPEQVQYINCAWERDAAYIAACSPEKIIEIARQVEELVSDYATKKHWLCNVTAERDRLLNEALKEEVSSLMENGLAKENKRLNEMLDETCADRDKHVFENKRLREALEKIANTSDGLEEDLYFLAREALSDERELPQSGALGET